jgi:hypothetical protein
MYRLKGNWLVGTRANKSCNKSTAQQYHLWRPKDSPNLAIAGPIQPIPILLKLGAARGGVRAGEGRGRGSWPQLECSHAKDDPWSSRVSQGARWPHPHLRLLRLRLRLRLRHRLHLLLLVLLLLLLCWREVRRGALVPASRIKPVKAAAGPPDCRGTVCQRQQPRPDAPPPLALSLPPLTCSPYRSLSTGLPRRPPLYSPARQLIARAPKE